MDHSRQNTLPDPAEFLERLFAHLDPYAEFFDPLYLDHLCYRVRTPAEYTRLRDALSTQNDLLVESRIGGRAIATFRLARPFTFGGRLIDVVELPAPKSGSPYPTGYEHAEFVCQDSLEMLEQQLVDRGIFHRDQIDRGGMNKSINRDLRVKLAPNLNVKFHERPLADVIAAELGKPKAGK